jgi:A/G-specific adenine glycosylase
MLAQTQVERVVPKFEAFVARFPDFPALARSSPADVLREWKGLGYNSRALRLRLLAKEVLERYGGALPSQSSDLRSLPGVGPYSAAAIRAFAFDIDDAPVDTNVLRIVQRLCVGLEFPSPAPRRELDERAFALVPSGRAHDWSSALMDLGATICTARAPKCRLCPLRADCVAAPIDAAELMRLRTAATRRKISVPFERTARYARGRIVDRLRALAPGERISLIDLHDELAPAIVQCSLDQIRTHVAALKRDGLVSDDGTRVALPE